MRFEKDEIIVATQDQNLPCGHVSVKKGTICKVKNPKPDRWNEIQVWKNKRREENDNSTELNQDYFRPSSGAKEFRAYYRGITNIAQLN